MTSIRPHAIVVDGAGAGHHVQSLAVLTAPRQHRISDPATVIKVRFSG